MGRRVPAARCSRGAASPAWPAGGPLAAARDTGGEGAPLCKGWTAESQLPCPQSQNLCRNITMSSMKKTLVSWGSQLCEAGEQGTLKAWAAGGSGWPARCQPELPALRVQGPGSQFWLKVRPACHQVSMGLRVGGGGEASPCSPLDTLR